MAMASSQRGQNALGGSGYWGIQPTGFSSPTMWTSTGQFLPHGTITVAPGPPPIPDADTVSVLPDGRIMLTVQGMKIAVPKHLFKDIVALSEMGMLRELVEKEGDDGAK